MMHFVISFVIAGFGKCYKNELYYHYYLVLVASVQLQAVTCLSALRSHQIPRLLGFRQ